LSAQNQHRQTLSALANLPLLKEEEMFINMGQPPPQATACLMVSAFGRNRGELVAHRLEGGQIVVEFLNPSFFGGKKIIKIKIDEFEKFFELIKK
jgi:hypothetical protein